MARLMKAFAALVLLCVVIPALADPVTLVVLATQAAVQLGYISVITGLAITLGANLISAADKRRQASSASDAALAAYNASLQDRNITVLRNDSPWQIVYGNPAPVGGSMVAILSSGTADQFKHMVVVFAAHECAGIDEVYIEGDPLGTLDDSGWVTGGAFMDSGTARVNCQKHLSPGGVDTADAFLIAAAPSNWTTAHKLSGYTYIVLTIDLNMSRFQGGPPNITAKLRGKKVYDYRTATTGYSANPALCVADFLTSVYGYAAGSGQIDSTGAIAAANACDTQGFNCHGALSTDNGRDTNLHALEDSMAGRTHWSGGVWRIIAGIWATPVMTLTDAYLAAPIEVTQAGNPRTQRYNSVRGKYVPSAQLGVTVDFTPYVVSSYVSADGPNAWLDTSYGFTATNSECQKLAAIAVERSRAGLTINYPAHLTAWKLQPGDRVYVTNTELGFAAKTFRVVDWTHINNAPLGLVLTEDVASMYTGTFSVSDPLASTSNLANPYAIPAAPPSLTVSSGTAFLAVLSDGTVQTRVYCAWTATTQRAVLQGGYAQIQWKLTTDSDSNYTSVDLSPDSTTALLMGPKDGTNITVRVRFITGVSSYGAWATTTHNVIGKTAPPSTPSNVIVAGKQIIFTGVTDADLAGYQLRAASGANPQWGAGAQLHTGLVRSSPFLPQRQLYGLQTIMVAAIDTTGNVGDFAWTLYDFSQPSIGNVLASQDFALTNFVGTITGGSAAGGTLSATLASSPDVYVLADEYSNTDMYAATYVAMQWVSTAFVPRYSGTITLVSNIAGIALVEYQIDGGTGNDAYGLADGYVSADLYGASSVWSTWPGSLDVKRGQGLIFRITTQGGSVQGGCNAFSVYFSMPLVRQTWTAQLIALGGSRLAPANGNPPYSQWVQVQTVQITPVADGSGATAGQVLDMQAMLGPSVQLLNSAGATVAGTATVDIGGFVDV